MPNWKVECQACGNEKEAEHQSFLEGFVLTCRECGSDVCPNCKSVHDKSCDEEQEPES